jgi:DNA-binding CsgD family transcriptional regulator
VHIGTSTIPTAPPPRFVSDVADIPGIIEAIGGDAFGPKLLSFLHEACGADHCAIFELGGDSLRELESASLDGTQTAHQQAALYATKQYWRRDPIILEAQRRLTQPRPSILRVDIGSMTDTILREAIYPNVSQRLVICGQRSKGAFGLSILRATGRGNFTDSQIDYLGSVSDLLVSVLSKHADVVAARGSLTRALTSLADIESCLLGATELTRREVEVCARILYGLSSIGIALDLGIGEESVKTYRKRAYQRLGIGSPREFLIWYLGLWGKAVARGALHPGYVAA